MKHRTFNSVRALALVLCVIIAACGGGGGGSGGNVPPPPPPPPSPPPSPTAFTIGGTVGGLNGTVVLRNNGGDELTVATNGEFHFVTPMTTGLAYNVTVKTHPADQICVVTNHNGTVDASNVTRVAVNCMTESPGTRSVAGIVTGLKGALVLTNRSEGLVENLEISVDGNFVFPSPLVTGRTYAVTVRTPPPNQTCEVANGTGTIETTAVTNVTVTCSSVAPGMHLIRGTVTGLRGTGLVLQNKGGDDLSIEITGDSVFTFATPVATNGTYDITILKQPVSPVQSCTVVNGSGMVTDAGVTAPVVQCVTQVARFVYVANRNDFSISMYAVDSATGQLRHRGHVFAQARPFAITVEPSGRFAYAANENHTVSAYRIGTEGELTLIREVPLDTQFVKAVTVDPSGAFVYVATALPDGKISAYRIAANGDLGFIASIAVGSVSDVLKVDPSGRFVYAVGNNPAGLSAFAIASDGSLSARQTFNTGFVGVSMAVDPSGRFGYVPFSGEGLRGYEIQPDGRLNQIGGEVALGGVPTAIAVDPSGRFVYVTLISGKVASFPIDATSGSLGAPSEFQAGTDPGSLILDPSGTFAFVTNASVTNASINSISTFSVNASGELARVGVVATRTLSVGNADPSAIAIVKGTSPVISSAKFAYVANTGSGNVSTFAVHADGVLELKGSTPEAGDAVSLAVAIHPGGGFAYVADQRLHTVTVFPIDPVSGVLRAPIGSAPLVNPPVGVTVDPSGRFVYAAFRINNAQAGVRVLEIDPDGTLIRIDDVLVVAGAAPVSITVGPTGRFLYGANPGANRAFAFAINRSNGRLESPTLTEPQLNTAPASITVHPSGRFAYLANSESGTVSSFALDPVSGVLGARAVSPAGAGARSVAVDPAGRFAYVANAGVGNVSVFPIIDPDSGTLGEKNDFPARPDSVAVTVDPSGKFAFVVNRSDDTVSVFPIDPATGALGVKVGDFATGRRPESIVITTALQ